MYFFFSYSRQNNESFLRDFFADLNQAVKDVVGIDEDAGFFDQTGLEPGEFWEKKLEQALSTSSVFIAAVTAGYAKSDYCGREWAAFEGRIQGYAKGGGIQSPPPLIIPVLWVFPEEPLPKEISARQYTYGDPGEDYNKKGLKRLYQLKQRYDSQRVDYLDALSRHIVTLAKQHAAMAGITTVPPLATTASVFSTAAEVPPGEAPVKGPQRVHFVFGAATTNEVKQAGRLDVGPYGAAGEEWRPYFPSTKRIGAIARQTAALDEFNFWPGQLTLSQDLPARVRDAENQRELVVIFVDGWTARLRQYQTILQAFDQQNYVNCSVIVPWNEGDAETATNKPRLLDALKNALRFRSTGQNDLYYRAQIRSEEELKQQLVDVLARLRAEVINKSAPSPGAIPDASGALASIAGPGSTGSN